MTAELVTQLGRRPYREFLVRRTNTTKGGHLMEPGPVGGDRMLPMLWEAQGGRPAGQLWERLNERTTP